MKLEFDWYEIKHLTENSESQLILLYSLYLSYKAEKQKSLLNKDYIILSNGRFEISKKLYFFWEDYRGQLDVLVTKKLVSRYGDTYFTAYKCVSPQNYLTNMEFLFHKIPVKYKIQYLDMISQRRMNDTNNWIPLEYVDKGIAYNPFTTVNNNKIYFNLEKNTYGN